MTRKIEISEEISKNFQRITKELPKNYLRISPQKSKNSQDFRNITHVNFPITYISLINVEPTLTDFEKFHPPQKQNPPSTKLFFLDHTKTVQVRP